MPDEKLTLTDLSERIENLKQAHQLERQNDLRRIDGLENAVVELSEYNRRLAFHLKRYVLKTNLPGEEPVLYQKVDEGMERSPYGPNWSPDDA